MKAVYNKVEITKTLLNPPHQKVIVFLVLSCNGGSSLIAVEESNFSHEDIRLEEEHGTRAQKCLRLRYLCQLPSRTEITTCPIVHSSVR